MAPIAPCGANLKPSQNTAAPAGLALYFRYVSIALMLVDCITV